MTTTITQKQYDECELFIKKSKITTAEVNEMMILFNKYVDSGTKCCATCPAQIRFIHKRFNGWFRQVEIFDTEELPTELLCVECEEPMYDKRRKYCSKKCRDKNKKERNGEEKK